jgi:hypothetical protein
MDLQKQKEKIVRKPEVRAESRPIGSEAAPSPETVQELVDADLRRRVAEEIERGTSVEETLTPSGPVIAQKSPYVMAVESVLEENLSELYLKLPENRRNAFRKEGEVVAGKIEKIIQSAKVNVKKIIDLIRGWLMMIPGVNKLFLEQEAKIKADKIVALRDSLIELKK